MSYSRILLSRGGSHPVDHALTFFRFVRLPRWAMLGETEPPANRRDAFFSSISRVISGTLSMGAFGVSAIELSSHIGAKYSQRRTVTDAMTGSRVPILSFSTQFTPVLSAVAYAIVFRAYANAAREAFVSPDSSLTQKHCGAAIFKATVMKHAKSIPLELGDRCGAQGLFGVNQLSAAHVSI
jgi:acyl-CoA oxidase